MVLISQHWKVVREKIDSDVIISIKINKTEIVLTIITKRITL